MSLADFGDHLTGQIVVVVYHGGCPDGCLAAVIMRDAISRNYKTSSLTLVPTSHAGRNADSVVQGCTVVFVDVSPTWEDESQLRKCGCIIILDHHASAQPAQDKLQAALPSLSNFSNNDGKECGATLVNNFCGSRLVAPWLIHLFHKMDVFQHQLPDGIGKHYDAFKGFITQRGLSRCTVELVEELLADTGAALARGSELYAEVSEQTRNVFEKRSLLADTELVSVFAVELGEVVPSMDLELYQSLIDQISSCSKVVVFATLNRTRLSSGLWTVGLRRSGEQLDMGTVGKRLGACDHLGFKTGGGHPYAAGAQCGDFELSAERVCTELAQICEGLLAECPDDS